MIRETLHAFIVVPATPDDSKARVLACTPASYLGKAADLARRTRALSTFG